MRTIHVNDRRHGTPPIRVNTLRNGTHECAPYAVLTTPLTNP